MDLFKNVYIILLSIVLPFVVGIESEPWGMFSIGYGVLAGAFFIYQKTKANEVDPILEKLSAKLDEIDDHLENGKGLIEIADEFYQKEGIPPVFTIKHVLYYIHEGCKEDVFQYTHVLDRKSPSDLGIIKLLDLLLVDVDRTSTLAPNAAIDHLDEFTNVLFIKENVTFRISAEGEETRKGFGVLILTLNALLFVPMKWEFLKNMDRGKLFDLLTQASSSIPGLNAGLATTELLLAFHESAKPAALYFNDERKQQMKTHYAENEGWLIPYSEMTELVMPYKMKGLKGVDHSLYIKTSKAEFRLWHTEESEDFKIELLEQLLKSSLLQRQIFYPITEKYEGRFVKCDLVPSSEIDFDDPEMIAYREQEIIRNSKL